MSALVPSPYAVQIRLMCTGQAARDAACPCAYLTRRLAAVIVTQIEMHQHCELVMRQDAKLVPISLSCPVQFTMNFVDTPHEVRTKRTHCACVQQSIGGTLY